jgi:hypothetical protein
MTSDKCATFFAEISNTGEEKKISCVRMKLRFFSLMYQGTRGATTHISGYLRRPISRGED